MALSKGQLATRLLALGGAGLLLGAIACIYGFTTSFGYNGAAPDIAGDVMVPLGILMILASFLALLVGAVLGIIALARR